MGCNWSANFFNFAESLFANRDQCEPPEFSETAVNFAPCKTN